MVDQAPHEHAASLPAADLPNRSRRLIKCAKDSGHYHLTIISIINKNWRRVLWVAKNGLIERKTPVEYYAGYSRAK